MCVKWERRDQVAAPFCAVKLNQNPLYTGWMIDH